MDQQNTLATHSQPTVHWGPVGILTLVGVLIALAGIYFPMSSTPPSEFCQAWDYGYPLKIQERVHHDTYRATYRATDPATGWTSEPPPCIDGRNTDSPIRWLYWLVNVAAVGGSFFLVGYVAQRTKWYWYLALPVVLVVLLIAGRILSYSGNAVTT